MTPARATVLVVDDEPLLRDILSEWLEFEGYRVLTAEDGEDALRVMETNPVEAIVTDVRMPKMDGLTFLKELHRSGNSVPPAILVSGHTAIAPREAYGLGVEAILSKPFTADQLVSAVRHVFTRREELWRGSAEAAVRQDLQATFATVAGARQDGKLAFGRGGFCVSAIANFIEGPLRFALHFSEDELRIAGLGMVRWSESGEGQIGVEILCLEAECLELGSVLAQGASSYIPRTCVFDR